MVSVAPTLDGSGDVPPKKASSAPRGVRWRTVRPQHQWAKGEVQQNQSEATPGSTRSPDARCPVECYRKLINEIAPAVRFGKAIPNSKPIDDEDRSGFFGPPVAASCRSIASIRGVRWLVFEQSICSAVSAAAAGALAKLALMS
jgi:hypothetical protein